jgi:DNA-binding IclR family transcriptional regulator
MTSSTSAAANQPDGQPGIQPAGRPGSKGGTDMVGKALGLLLLIGEAPLEGVVLSDLAKRTGFPLSTAHRLVGTLVRDGFVEFDEPTRRYRLGLASFRLAHRVASQRGFEGMALPILRQLTELTQETAVMAVRDGIHQLYIHHLQGPLQLNVIGEPGTLGPLHCTSTGKVLIAFAAPDVRRDLVENLELVRFGPNTITDRDAFAEEIENVRARGYALADQEHEDGIRAAACPVMSGSGVAKAAVSVAAPAFRRSREDMIGFVPALAAAARDLAILLPDAP